MRTLLITIGFIGSIATTATAQTSVPAATPATSDASVTRTGNHPAVGARRVIAASGYDYGSKFYPHPAGLALLAEAPRPMSDHPAVAVFRRTQAEHRAALQAASLELARR
jgi:hypothetical protein